MAPWNSKEHCVSGKEAELQSEWSRVCQCGCLDEDTGAHINYCPGGHDKDCHSLSVTEAPEGTEDILGPPC